MSLLWFILRCLSLLERFKTHYSTDFFSFGMFQMFLDTHTVLLPLFHLPAAKNMHQSVFYLASMQRRVCLFLGLPSMSGWWVDGCTVLM